MTDQKPAGVFVRLPLSDEAASTMRDYIMSQILTKDALEHTLLTIGTPVQGGELYPIGYINEDAIRGLATGIYQSASIFRDYDAEHHDTVSLTRQSEAQAQIAARDAEIVRLREALQAIAFEIPSPSKADKVGIACQKIASEALKGGAA